MINEDLVAERIAIDSYRDIIQYLGEQTRPRAGTFT
jgi:bacterioferritin (cytochrome b1)